MNIKCEPCNRSFPSYTALRVHKSKGLHKNRVSEINNGANNISQSKCDEISADISDIHKKQTDDGFVFEGRQIRVIKWSDDIWFCAKDITAALEYIDSVNAIKTHVDGDDKIIYKNLQEKCGGGSWQNFMLSEIDQQSIFINESGLYTLIFGSKMPRALKFKKWVISEVLPSIRKNGIYKTPESVNPNLEYVDRHSREALALMDTLKMDVIYIYEIHASNIGSRRAYKYGITYELDVRGNKHRDKYKCDLTLVKKWKINLPRCTLMQLETSIGIFASNIGLRENYMNSRETFMCDTSDDESLQKMIEFIEAAIVENENYRYNQDQPDLIKFRMDHEYRLAKLSHDQEMMQLNVKLAVLNAI